MMRWKSRSFKRISK